MTSARMPGRGPLDDRPTVFVHVGPGKTGTSTIQRALNEQRDVLADLGVLVPGRVQMDTRHAVYDLMGRRIEGADRRHQRDIAGSWAGFAASIAASPLPSAAFSEEMLALARPRAVRRLVDALAPRRVVVVATVRDLASALTSYWQQMVMMGRGETLPEFLAAVRDPTAAAGLAVGFWLRQDLLRTLDAWERLVPREDVRLVTVPPAGSPPELLADRFAEVLGVPEGVLRSSRSRGNSSLGLAEIEVVRRLNVELDGRLREHQRLHLMRVVREGLAGRRGRRITLPEDELDWVTERASELVAALRDRGYQVVGSLDDLLPARPETGPADPASVLAGDEVTEAAVAVLTAVAREQAALFSRSRQRPPPGGSGGAAAAGSAPARLGSSARAATFRLRMRALEKADRSRLFGWAARTYLRLTSRR